MSKTFEAQTSSAKGTKSQKYGVGARAHLENVQTAP
jgi:hypothetical protein